jgi:hypothetical protein
VGRTSPIRAAAILLVLLTALGLPALGSARGHVAGAHHGVTDSAGRHSRVRTHVCFYYPASGFGLWATRNVSCRSAKRVYRAAVRRIPSDARLHRTIKIDGYRCRMRFDGGGSGKCSASRHRRITFNVP